MTGIEHQEIIDYLTQHFPQIQMVKSQQPQQILTTFKQKAPEKLWTKNHQNIQHIKHQR